MDKRGISSGEVRMEELRRLSIVVEHWIEHNQSHMNEYEKWAQRAAELGLGSVKAEIEKAINILSQTNLHLEKALRAITSKIK
jgi:hypothetical protein